MSDAPRPEGAEEDLGVRLEWPMDPIGEPFAPPDAGDAEAPPEEAPRVAAPPYAAVTPSRPSRPAAMESLPSMASALAEQPSAEGVATLAAIAARVDVLAAVTTTFRNQLADRISQTEDHLSELVHLQREVPAGLETRVGRRLDQIEAAVAGAVRTMSDVSTAVGGIQEALAALAEDVQGVRRRVAMRGRGAPIEAAQVAEIAEAVAELLRQESPPPPRKRRPPRPS